MATHYSIFAWRIPWTEEPGQLQSMGSQKVTEQLALELYSLTLTHTHTHRPYFFSIRTMSFPCGSAGKESACNAGDLSLIPGLGRSPGEGKGLPTPAFWS